MTLNAVIFTEFRIWQQNVGHVVLLDSNKDLLSLSRTHTHALTVTYPHIRINSHDLECYFCVYTVIPAQHLLKQRSEEQQRPSASQQSGCSLKSQVGCEQTLWSVTQTVSGMRWHTTDPSPAESEHTAGLQRVNRKVMQKEVTFDLWWESVVLIESSEE